MKSVSRRSFLKTAGVAAGAAAVAAAPASAMTDPAIIPITPTAPVSREPVIAIVRDGGLGEVTVLSGTTERTVKDRQLATRLLKVARHNKPSPDGREA
jgi:hypothetical protein